MRKWYRMVVEYESRDEWSISVVPGLDAGDQPGIREAAAVLRTVAMLMSASSPRGEKAPGVVYESPRKGGVDGTKS